MFTLRALFAKFGKNLSCLEKLFRNVLGVNMPWEKLVKTKRCWRKCEKSLRSSLRSCVDSPTEKNWGPTPRVLWLELCFLYGAAPHYSLTSGFEAANPKQQRLSNKVLSIFKQCFVTKNQFTFCPETILELRKVRISKKRHCLSTFCTACFDTCPKVVFPTK